MVANHFNKLTEIEISGIRRDSTGLTENFFVDRLVEVAGISFSVCG